MRETFEKIRGWFTKTKPKLFALSSFFVTAVVLVILIVIVLGGRDGAVGRLEAAGAGFLLMTCLYEHLKARWWRFHDEICVLYTGLLELSEKQITTLRQIVTIQQQDQDLIDMTRWGVDPKKNYPS